MQHRRGRAVCKLVYSILSQAWGRALRRSTSTLGGRSWRIPSWSTGAEEAAHVPQAMIVAVISRLKIHEALDIAEKRIPQGWPRSASWSTQPGSTSPSTLPTQRRRLATIRNPRRSKRSPSLDDLGMDSRPGLASRRSSGLRCGAGHRPTCSGSRRRSHAALSRLNEIEKKIITIEDPVE